MQETPLADLELYHLPMNETLFQQDPMAYLHEARAKHSWLASCPHGFVVYQLSAIHELLRRDDKVTTAFEGVIEQMGAKGSAWGRFTAEQMIAHSGVSHKRLRNLLAPRFTPRQADLHRHLMRSVISQLLDEWSAKQQFDFEEFASFFPISVMCAMVGAPRDSIQKLRSSLEAMGLAFSMRLEMLPQLETAIGVLDDFVQSLVSERRNSSADEKHNDLLQLLIASASEGGLKDRELYDLLIFMFVAGYDTSKNVLTYTMNLMIDHPAEYIRCAKDFDYCRKGIEESLRIFSPGTVFRFVIDDMVFRDVILPKGTMLFFPLSIAGRDPTAYEDAETFNPERVKPIHHAAFGRGMHLCLGQYIARAQLEEGLHQIAQRLRNPVRIGATRWRPFFGAWGLESLPVKFDVVASTMT